jgi:integrase
MKAKLADDPDLWKIEAGRAKNRRWLTRHQVNDLMDEATPRQQLIVALGAWNGRRAVETCRLRWRDVNMAAASPTLSVWGKGRHGGKDDTIPMNRLVWKELLPLSLRVKKSDPVFPFA